MMRDSLFGILLGAGLSTLALSGSAHARSPIALSDVPVPATRPLAGADVPVPVLRPQRDEAGEVAAIDQEETAAIPTPDNPQASPDAFQGQLKAGLDALYSKKVDLARTIRDSMAPSLDKDILTWAIALSGFKGIPSAEIAAAARSLPDWPGLAALRANSERALYNENPPPDEVLAAFGSSKPQTAEGAIILARALMATGNQAGAIAALAPIWRNRPLDADTEKMILSEFGNIIPPADHFDRMIHMLYEDRIDSARRVAGFAHAESLFAAWSAVIRNAPDAATKIAAVDPVWRSNPVFLFIRAQYNRRNQHFEEAYRLLMRAPRSARALVEPDEWWIERRIVSRGLLDMGDARHAYELAATHCCETPVMAAEAEFHAGWYALRALHDPRLAEPHFARIAALSSRPLSRSRAYYWLGRSAEAGGPGDAKAWYEKAAHYGTTFYGQLAAAKLGRTTLDLPYPRPTLADRDAFDRLEAVRAIRRLQDIGYGWRADILYSELAEELRTPGELALLAKMAQDDDNDFMVLRIGKIGVSRGLDVGALAHPVGVIPDNVDISGSGRALAYAVARQESEFNIAAVSRAGARGLLQLMPSTARAMARRAGLPYSKARLTTDAGYNATLGARFLDEQITRFGGSYVLTFASYNAGPRRAEEWIARYGDPRGEPVDKVVDWIEHIPYTETRNYVERVMENFEVYKARLYGHTNIAADLTAGKKS